MHSENEGDRVAPMLMGNFPVTDWRIGLTQQGEELPACHAGAEMMALNVKQLWAALAVPV